MTIVRNRPLGRNIYLPEMVTDKRKYLSAVLRDCMKWIKHVAIGHDFIPCWNASNADPDLGTIIGCHFLRNCDCSNCGGYPEPDGSFYAQLLAMGFLFLNQHGLITESRIDIPTVEEIYDLIGDDPIILSITYRCFYCGHMEVIKFDANRADCSKPIDKVIINQGKQRS